MESPTHLPRLLHGRGGPWRYLAYGLIIGLLANLSALINLLLHPEIPYLSGANGIIGGILALLAAILCFLLESHIRRTALSTSPARFGFYPWILVVFWTVLAGASLTWSIYNKHQETLAVAKNEARTIFEKDLLYYRWAANQNGVFVPVTETTGPNPYLKNLSDTSALTDSGNALTLVNPEYMIRQVYEMKTSVNDARGHITSLDPVRPGNAADPWEAEALRAFEDGELEVSAIQEMDGQEYFRLMRPMITEQGCLKCHADQGYDVGDIRGGICVSVPMTLLNGLMRKDILTMGLAHGALWLLGLLGILLGAYQITGSIREKEQAETRLRAIINNMLDGLITMDANGTIESLNASAAAMFGYYAEEAVGRPLNFLIRFSVTTTGKELPTALREAIAAGRPLQGLRNDGDSFPVAVSLSEMRLDTRRIFIIMVRDITEEEQRRSEALRAGQLAAIGELAAGVAHEINNPVNGIINYSQVLLDVSEDNGDQTFQDILKRIIREGERVAAIVSNLLAFARQRDEIVGDVNLRVVIDDCVALLLYQLDKDQIKLSVDIPEDLPLLKGNPQQLHQVFLNLLSNSRYALNQRFPGHDPDKRIEISSREVSVDGRPFIRTTVTDHGIGIPQDLIDRIFDSLFTTKPPGEGTGLGLSISKGLVRDHAGQLTLESVPGDHTVAIVDLPAAANGEQG
ncbi:c-type heme family protein [Thiovibrio sp. JS02]